MTTLSVSSSQSMHDGDHLQIAGHYRPRTRWQRCTDWLRVHVLRRHAKHLKLRTYRINAVEETSLTISERR